MKVSYMELYNEQINDLLEPSKKNLDVRENKDKGIYVDQLSEYEVKNLEDTINYLEKGDE
jgi:kinesin family protein 15